MAKPVSYDDLAAALGGLGLSPAPSRDEARGQLARAVADHPDPPAAALRTACRALAQQLAEQVPGRSVELRVPPYAAVQCVPGPRHTRGTPPNVVEVRPHAWVQLATGRLAWPDAVRDGRVAASGERADLSEHLPLVHDNLA